MKFACKALSMALALVLFLAGTAQAAGPFVDNGDGTGTDESTNITWLKTDVKAGTYDDSCIYCQRLVRGGYDDWRVPNVQEAITLIDYLEGIDPVFDTNAANSWTNNKKWNKSYLLNWTIVDDGVTRTHSEAKTYCENVVFAGRDDWRLPTANEIVAITDYTPYDEWARRVDAALAIERGRSHYNSWTSSNSNASGYRVRPSFIDGLGLMIIVTRIF